MGWSLAILGRLLAGAAAVSVHAQSAPAAKAAPDRPYAAKTPWGDPDLQGVWDYKTITPLERPANFGDRQTLTDEEVARLESNAAKRRPRRSSATRFAASAHATRLFMGSSGTGAPIDGKDTSEAK